MLAHAINNNYSAAEAKQLLNEVTTESTEKLAQQLLTGSPIFSEENYEAQIEKIKNFKVT